MNLFHLVLIIMAVIALAVGDVFLKKAALDDSLWQVFKSPWLMGAMLLYLYQILFVTYFFHIGWQLSIIGTLQTAFYALIVILAGIFYFGETLTPVQIAGIVVTLCGVVFINAS